MDNEKSKQLSDVQKEFFKDSAIRNSNGDMITCYHYTVHNFDAFDINTIGKQSGDNGFFGEGFYFTAMPSFNSCCWPDKEKGEKLIKLECYLNLKNPFYIEKLGKPDYDSDNPYLYDAESFLRFIKNNSYDTYNEGSDIILSDDDFIKYLKDEHVYDNEYQELIEKYEEGSIEFYDEIDGASLDQLYYEAERSGDIITPNNITFSNLHRGMLSDYSKQISEYAVSHGFDGIVSDGLSGKLSQPVEIVVFEPNQIKLTDNLYPTNSPKFNDNKEEYFQIQEAEDYFKENYREDSVPKKLSKAICSADLKGVDIEEFVDTKIEELGLDEQYCKCQGRSR